MALMMTRHLQTIKNVKTYFYPKNKYFSRFMHFKSSDNSRDYNNKTDCSTNVKELLIPVPYGNIAAKAWGEASGFPVLALHGWLDNCGTFDRLIPVLSPQYYVIAIDMPGHGLSSYMPFGCHYSDTSLTIDLKRIIDFFGWTEFNIIGHSLGGGLALVFASIFPELVKKMAIIDMFKPSSRAIYKFPGETRKAINNHFKNEMQMSKTPPLYTFETAAQRLQKGMHYEVSLEGAKILNKRGTRLSDCGKGIIFSRDLRCRTVEEFSRKSNEYVEQFMSAVQCELLLILANNTHPNYQSSTPEVKDKFIDIYKKNCKRFVLERVDGNHFVHLNNPEITAPLINEFFG